MGQELGQPRGLPLCWLDGWLVDRLDEWMVVFASEYIHWLTSWVTGDLAWLVGCFFVALVD